MASMRKFKIRYVGGALGIIGLTVMSLTVVLIPLATVSLLQDLEIIEKGG